MGSSIAKIPLSRTMKAVLPFCAVEILVLLLATYVPDVVLGLPKLLGMI